MLDQGDCKARISCLIASFPHRQQLVKNEPVYYFEVIRPSPNFRAVISYRHPPHPPTLLCWPRASCGKCVRHGHELVCLGNLYPPAAASDEADSFMYQSAAHTAIEAQAECFGKPLIRR